VSRDLIEQLAQAVHGDCWPSTTLLLDLPVALGRQRMAMRRGGADRIEAEADAFFQRVRACYLQIARDEPQRVRLLDASAPSAQLQQQALAMLVERGA
jgi:dTMP kinase